MATPIKGSQLPRKNLRLIVFKVLSTNETLPVRAERPLDSNVMMTIRNVTCGGERIAKSE